MQTFVFQYLTKGNVIKETSPKRGDSRKARIKSVGRVGMSKLWTGRAGFPDALNRYLFLLRMVDFSQVRGVRCS